MYVCIVFVNMCSFLIFVFNTLLSEVSRCVFAGLCSIIVRVIIKYCVLALQVWMCSFKWDTCSPAAQNLVQKHRFRTSSLTEMTSGYSLYCFSESKECWVFLEIWFHYVFHISFKFIILLPRPTECWDCGHMSPHPAIIFFHVAHFWVV